MDKDKTPGDLKASQELQEMLLEKDSLIKAYEESHLKLIEDFNYNVSLIYDRDKEIDRLNKKIDELLNVNREKDIQLVSLQSLYVRVKQLEADNAILSGRIEFLLSQNPKSSRKGPLTPKNNYVSPQLHRRSNSKPLEPVSSPLNKLNFELEKRIQALEIETHPKVQDCQTPQSKNQDISEMIKCLSPSKRSKRSFNNFNSEVGSFLKDLRNIREGVAKDMLVSVGETEHVPIIRS